MSVETFTITLEENGIPKAFPVVLLTEYQALEARCKRYEEALILITENSLYCDHCSASLYAKQALEQREGE